MRCRYKNYKLVCAWCGDKFPSHRHDAKTCGLRCRSAKNRALKQMYAKCEAENPKEAAKQKQRPSRKKVGA